MKEDILNVIDEYLLIFQNEKEREKQLLEFINSHNSNDITDWNNFDGHIVVSGFIYSKKLKKLLVVYHKDLKMYLYPGGHIDKNDKSLLDAVRREIYEETGLDNVELFNYSCNEVIPFDIDTHKIRYNERLDLPAHYHFDFRYIFFTDNTDDIKIDEEESSSYKWIDIDELRESTHFGKIADKLEKLLLE